MRTLARWLEKYICTPEGKLEVQRLRDEWDEKHASPVRFSPDPCPHSWEIIVEQCEYCRELRVTP